MGKTLIIAEKPSVMTDLSRALAQPLGRFEKKGTGRDAFYENGGGIYLCRLIVVILRRVIGTHVVFVGRHGKNGGNTPSATLPYILLLFL